MLGFVAKNVWETSDENNKKISKPVSRLRIKSMKKCAKRWKSLLKDEKSLLNVEKVRQKSWERMRKCGKSWGSLRKCVNSWESVPKAEKTFEKLHFWKEIKSHFLNLWSGNSKIW